MLTFLRYLEQRTIKFGIGARNWRTTMGSMVLLFRSGLANLHAAPRKFPSKLEKNKALFITWNRVLGSTSTKNDSKLRSLKNWD